MRTSGNLTLIALTSLTRISSVPSQASTLDDRRRAIGEKNITEHIKRKAAVVIVISVKKPLLLLAVDGNVGGIKIQNQGFRGLLETVKKQLTEQLFNPLGIPGDFAVPVLGFFIQFMTEFQSVQGALPCRWSFIIPPAYILKQWISVWAANSVSGPRLRELSVRRLEGMADSHLPIK